MDRLAANEASKVIVEKMAQMYRDYFPDSVVKVYKDEDGNWRWNADGVEMMSVQFEGEGDNN